jgi:antitoxin component of RelBE/YafQ-DinJ toxin-antitoxin module
VSNTILQVPVSKDLRNQAALMADEMGFSSLQEVVRLFMAKLASGMVEVTFQEPVQLSPRAVRRYEKMIREVEGGKVKTKSFTSVEALMKDLNA